MGNLQNFCVVFLRFEQKNSDQRAIEIVERGDQLVLVDAKAVTLERGDGQHRLLAETVTRENRFDRLFLLRVDRFSGVPNTFLVFGQKIRRCVELRTMRSKKSKRLDRDRRKDNDGVGPRAKMRPLLLKIAPTARRRTLRTGEIA